MLLNVINPACIDGYRQKDNNLESILWFHVRNLPSRSNSPTCKWMERQYCGVVYGYRREVHDDYDHGLTPIDPIGS